MKPPLKPPLEIPQSLCQDLRGGTGGGNGAMHGQPDPHHAEDDAGEDAIVPAEFMGILLENHGNLIGKSCDWKIMGI